MKSEEAGFVKLRVQHPEGADGVYERVPVEPDGEDLVRVTRSPVLVENIAVGDVISVFDDGTFEVIRRGGNLTVQFFRGKPPDPESESLLMSTVAALGGWLDVKGPAVLVYCVPFPAKGFAELEDALNKAASAAPRATWMYGNVYDPADGVSPLNWWTGVTPRQ